MKLKILLAAVCLSLSANSYAATYYVDQTAGNDSSAGTSPSAPWKNCPGMASFTGSGSLRPGDTVYFDKGDTWPVTGTQGLYLVGGVTYIGDSWGATGTRATIKASADLGAGVVRFRDHSTIPTILTGFDVDANNKVASGIDINHAFYVAPQTGAIKRIQNCVVHNISSRLSLGQYKYGIIVSNHGGTSGAVENVEILDSVVHDVSRDAICLYPGDENAACRIKNITVRHSEAYNTGQDPDYCCGAGIVVKGYVQDATIENNYIHDVKGASIFINGNETNHFGVGPTNIHVRYNIVTNATVNGAIRLYDGSGGGDPKDVKVYGNIVYNSTVNGGFLIDSDLRNTLSLLVYNNTFYNAPVIINNNSASVTTFEFRNNVVYSTGSVPLTDAARKITSHSNNIYYRGSGTLVSSGGTNYSSTNLATYESSASAANPQFKNGAALPTGFTSVGTGFAPNSDGLSLASASFGVDHGLPVSPYNGSINAVARPAGAGWDIGAYELGSAAGVADFDGDGKSDILWRHAAAGDLWRWPMDGAARTAETYVRTIADPDWEIRGLGDQTGDGKADILWRHNLTGMVYLWPMDGGTVLSETYVATVDPAYDIVGTGDFNGDGKADILWRHQTMGAVWIWLMNGATPLSQVYVGTVAPAYVVKGSGDLDGDDRADIVWQQATAGDVWVWLMNGTTPLSQTYVGTVPDTHYQIQQVADFDGNGRADLLWWNTVKGDVWIWTMNGATRQAETWVATVPDTNYRIVGAGDYDGDLKADILWHHATRGDVWMWLMDGPTRLSETWIATVPDTGYQIVKVM